MRIRPAGSGDEGPLVEAIGQRPGPGHESNFLLVPRSTISMTTGERSREPRENIADARTGALTGLPRCVAGTEDEPAEESAIAPAPVIGLTGGVASGKSSVAIVLAEQGFAVIDADAVGHEVLDLPGVQQKLIDQFGPEVVAPGGTSTAIKPRIDRKALGAIVFADLHAKAAPGGDRSSFDAGPVRPGH